MLLIHLSWYEEKNNVYHTNSKKNTPQTYNVHPVQNPRATRERGLQSKKHYPKQSESATKTQGATREGRDFNQKINPKQESREKLLFLFKTLGGLYRDIEF